MTNFVLGNIEGDVPAGLPSAKELDLPSRWIVNLTTVAPDTSTCGDCEVPYQVLLACGTGSPSFTPVMTKFGFSWRNGQGGFECLALAPSVAAGKPGSGNFDTNAMYVTGSLTSAQVRGQTAVLQGTATVTGLGAGTSAAFTATVTRGGPGATLVLVVDPRRLTHDLPCARHQLFRLVI
jgi:hypothetical protein